MFKIKTYRETFLICVCFCSLSLFIDEQEQGICADLMTEDLSRFIKTS